ncbi:MAG: L,D-transpeptidase [Nitrospirae bacterium]|nr:L,D-transpeptidase [Nitrospirota bacterium]
MRGRTKRGLAKVPVTVLLAVGGFLLVVCPGGSPLEAGEEPAAQERQVPPNRKQADGPESLRARYAALKRQLEQQAPDSPYIVVDTARNLLIVKRRQEVLLMAIASTGSGTILDHPDRPGTQWVFDTPRGEFKIQSRLTNPVWVKPDWAFLEEGLKVPKDQASRLEPGILGEYALGFGKGYFIHGTLYTRLLGKNVTHGCIRLSDEDLRTVHRLSKVGTPVMIF